MIFITDSLKICSPHLDSAAQTDTYVALCQYFSDISCQFYNKERKSTSQQQSNEKCLANKGGGEIHLQKLVVKMLLLFLQVYPWREKSDLSSFKALVHLSDIQKLTFNGPLIASTLHVFCLSHLNHFCFHSLH